MHSVGAAIEDIEHGLAAHPLRRGVRVERFEELAFRRLARSLQRILELTICLDDREVLSCLVLAPKRRFLRITLAQTALYGLLVRRDPTVQHMGFRQIELIDRVLHGEAHRIMVLRAHVMCLEQPLVPLRRGVCGIEVRLDEALPREPARLGEQRKLHFRVVVKPVISAARFALDPLLGDCARMVESLLQQRIRVGQTVPFGVFLPASRTLSPALGAKSRSLGATAGLGIFGCVSAVMSVFLIVALPIFGKLALRHGSTFPANPLHTFRPL